MGECFDLERFVAAQAPVIGAVRAELAAGRKRGHWMWFVFPQIRGLGSSAMARRFAIGSLDEARAYIAHPMLGPRLRECARLASAHHGLPIEAIFGEIDARKFRSSMTLFARASGGEAVFTEALDRHFGGEADEATLARL